MYIPSIIREARPVRKNGKLTQYAKIAVLVEKSPGLTRGLLLIITGIKSNFKYPKDRGYCSVTFGNMLYKKLIRYDKLIRGYVPGENYYIWKKIHNIK